MLYMYTHTSLFCLSYKYICTYLFIYIYPEPNTHKQVKPAVPAMTRSASLLLPPVLTLPAGESGFDCRIWNLALTVSFVPSCGKSTSIRSDCDKIRDPPVVHWRCLSLFAFVYW